MPDSTTTNFGFTLPEVNGSDDTWGEKLNDNWESIDGHLKNVKDRAEASVRFDAAMSLNATQQTRARENIGANNASNLSAGTVPNERLPERLREAPISQSGANANNILTTGWHYVTNGSNMPLGSAGQYLFVYRSGAGDQYVTQMAWGANDSTDERPRVFWRMRVNGTWTDWVKMVHYGNIDPWAFQPLGVPIPSYLGSYPSNSNSYGYRYVVLSAGRSDYHGNTLTNESVSGSAPNITATAVINLSASPLHGQTVRLLNNENRFLRAGHQSARGNVENDAIQNITGQVTSTIRLFGSASGALALVGSATKLPSADTSSAGVSNISFDASRVVRTANETRPRNMRVAYLMRIL